MIPKRENDDFGFSQFKRDENLSTFLFSVNKQKRYALKNSEEALNCYSECGPTFGWRGLHVFGDYKSEQNIDMLCQSDTSFYSRDAVEGELCGSFIFPIDIFSIDSG